MNYSKVLLIGNGHFADECIKILVDKEISFDFIEVFYEEYPCTENLCAKFGVPFYHYDKQEVTSFLMNIEEKTLIISAHNSYIFPPSVCDKPNLTIINLHIALLPQYRGMNPSTWAIFNQEKNAGVTWHTVSARIDDGEIIVQGLVPIGPDDTAMVLMIKCFKAGIKLFSDNIESFLNEAYSIKSNTKKNTRLYLAKEIPNGGYVDDTWDFEKTYAFLRSMDYSNTKLMPFPKIKIDGMDYEIVKYRKQILGESLGERTLNIDENELMINWGSKALICKIRCNS